jgi:hypothetical protein
MQYQARNWLRLHKEISRLRKRKKVLAFFTRHAELQLLLRDDLHLLNWIDSHFGVFFDQVLLMWCKG